MATNSKSYHHGNLKEALLDAAENQLASDGINRLSLRGIAKLSGVSHNAPYRHFMDKSALLRAIAERGFNELRKTVAAAAAADGPTEQRLIDAGVAYVRLALANPDRTRLMFAGSLEGAGEDAEFQAAANSAFMGLMGLVESGVEQGIFFGDPGELALTAWSGVHGFSLLLLSGSALREADDSQRLQMARQVAARIVNGLMRKSSMRTAPESPSS
ncbi:MAG: TetR/AcrR family transcriptional regulator [Candidatus Thiodiazotropha sp.]